MKLRLSLTIICCIVISWLFAQVNNQENDSTNHLSDEQIRYVADSLFDDETLSYEQLYEAFVTYERQLKSKLNNETLGLAYLIHRKGVVSYRLGLLGNRPSYHDAIAHYKEAVTIRKGFLQSDKHIIVDVINGLNNIAGCYIKVDYHYQAQEYLQRALLLANDQPPSKRIQLILYKLNLQAARTYRRLGDYDNSLLHYENLKQLIVFDSTKNDQAIRYHIYAWSESGAIKMLYLYRQDEALEDLKSAKRQMLASDSKFSAANKAGVYHNLGIAHTGVNEYDEAIRNYLKSIELSSSYKRKKTQAIAHSYLNLAVVYIRSKKLDSANYYLSLAEKYYNELNDQQSLSGVFDNRGDLLMIEANYEAAITHYNKAFELLITEFENTSIHSNPPLRQAPVIDKQRVLVSLGSKAKALIELYRQTGQLKYLTSAWTTLNLADYLIALIRSEFVAESSKMTLSALVKPIYEQAIEVCWMLNASNPADSLIAQAYSYSEKNRGIVLREAIKRTEVAFDLPEKLTQEESAINLRINYFEKGLAQGSSLAGLEDSLLNYRRKLTAIRTEISTKFPTYSRAIYQFNPSSIQAIRQRLTQDQTVLEFFFGEQSLYAFLINSDTIVFNKVEQADSIRTYALELIAATPRQDQSFMAPAYDLYRALIVPFKDSGLIKNTIYIIPDDILGSISFESLVTEAPNEQIIYLPGYSDYLLNDHAVAYAFSGQLFLNDKIAKGASGLLAIAPPFTTSFSIDDKHFDALNNNDEEVQQLATIYPDSKIIIDRSGANEFIQNASDFRIIHLATHSRANSENGDLSYIVFGQSADEILYTKDVYNLKLNADLVVLSACETAIGTVNRGEGIINLARSFLYAGAAAVATNLWDVRERSNQEIVLKFHQNLANDQTKSTALQQAKLQYLTSISKENQHLAHPYFWAPLILVGNDSVITESSNTMAFVLISILLLIVFIASSMRRKSHP